MLEAEESTQFGLANFCNLVLEGRSHFPATEMVAKARPTCGNPAGVDEEKGRKTGTWRGH
jgi:hypothetical protein